MEFGYCIIALVNKRFSILGKFLILIFISDPDPTNFKSQILIRPFLETPFSGSDQNNRIRNPGFYGHTTKTEHLFITLNIID